MTNQLNIFLLLFGSLQGFLISIWILKNRKHKLANLYLIILLVAVGLQLTFKVMTKTWLMEHAGFAYRLSYKFPYLMGPLLFLYVKARTINSFNKLDLLHFIPFMGSMIIVSLTRMGFWPDAWLMHPYTHAALQITSLTLYGILSLRLSSSKLRPFIHGVMAAEIIIAATLALMYMHYGSFPDVRLLFIILTVLIYWVSYKIVSEPDLLIENDSTLTRSLSLIRKNKYAHSSLKPEEAIRIESAIRQLMVNEKYFLDSSLTIETLASKIQTSRHHLSQVFNEKIGKTYSEFVTDLRLAETKIRLCDPGNYRYTIAAIALDSGFNSVSGFNDIFKKRFGLTPSQFRNSHLNRISA
jgi:AraC-like DNA-binding protein